MFRDQADDAVNRLGTARSADDDDDDFEQMTHARYFMGYFWWQHRKRGEGLYALVTTWWAFFGPRIKREWLSTFFLSVGYAIGFMIARTLIIPDWLQQYYEIDTSKR